MTSENIERCCDYCSSLNLRCIFSALSCLRSRGVATLWSFLVKHRASTEGFLHWVLAQFGFASSHFDRTLSSRMWHPSTCRDGVEHPHILAQGRAFAFSHELPHILLKRESPPPAIRQKSTWLQRAVGRHGCPPKGLGFIAWPKIGPPARGRDEGMQLQYSIRSQVAESASAQVSSEIWRYVHP